MREVSEERGEKGRRGWDGLEEKWLWLDIYLCTTGGKRAFEHTLEGTMWH